MAFESPANVIASLPDKLRLDDPFVQSRSWDSLPSQGIASSQPPSRASPYETPTLSEPSLVRLSMNALKGVESALMTLEKISVLLRYSSADRMSHRIPSLWTRCSSTSSVGNLLTSIGQFGCIVFLLHGFVDYFVTPDFSGMRELEVADPVHSALLKFLFLQSYEPYSDFIRSWIYDGSISDPYCKFVVECVEELSVFASDDMGSAVALRCPALGFEMELLYPVFLKSA